MDMSPLTATGLLLILALAVASPTSAAQRDSIPEKYTWNLAEIYPSERAWVEARDRAIGALAGLRKHEGRLGDSPQALRETLESWAKVEETTNRIATYAKMRYDLDQRVGRAQQMDQQARQLQNDLQAAISWIRPAILALGVDRVRSSVAAEPGLAAFRQPLEDILRRAPHTLPSDEERIVAMANNMSSAGFDIRGIFVNADLPYPEVTLSTGETVRLDAAGYARARAASSRDDRLKVFRAFWTAYSGFTRTLATALNAQVQAHVFVKDVRKFESSLEASLFADHIPTQVYTRLLDDVHANLSSLHRYLDLRRRMMGLDRLGYEDLYAPIVPKYERSFSPEEAMASTVKAVKPLGAEYERVLRAGFESRWVDWLPSTGKRSGAYSTGVYGLHPFQLQNFTGLYDEVSTLAHESGHSMHTYLADRAQPYPTHDYPIFVAEVASTLNENLLFHSMLEGARGDDERLFLLGSYVDTLRTTLFRQTLFAEFELRVHEMLEKGEPLTADALGALYLKLAREYYGHDEGICAVDDLYAAEWAYIPHLHYNFYVYQYATSIIASISIADGILSEAARSDGSTARRDAYLRMLSAGSSRYAFDLLKEAGVDLTTSAPFQAAVREMNRVMDQMETILARRK